MKWYDNSYDNTKIKKIPYRLLKVNNEIYDSIFERDGKYILSIKCGVATYSRKNKYANFVTDGYKMIYELPAEEQKEIELDLDNLDNFLQENKTVISSIPGSDISLDANIDTEYIAHRQLDKSIIIKYDNYSLQDFPMDKRNYNEDIIVERLINNTKESIGYQKEDAYYFDITENKDYIKVIEDSMVVNDELKTDGNSIELPSSLGSNVSWNIEQSADIVLKDTVEGESLKLIEIWGDSWRDTSCGKNLYDESLPTTEGVLLWNTGGIYVVGGYITTSFIEIEPNTSYTFSADGIDQRYCLFDKNQKYLSGAMANTFSSGNASYVRLSGNSMRRIQLEKGINATAYEPYCQPNFSNIQHVGELYTDSRGRSILNREGNEQYKIDIYSRETLNLFPTKQDRLEYRPRIKVHLKPGTYTIFSDKETQFTLFKYTRDNGDQIDNINYWSQTRLQGKAMTFTIDKQCLKNVDYCYLENNWMSGDHSLETFYNANIRLFEGTKDLYNGKKDHRSFTYDEIYTNPKISKATILLPCQLMKVRDVADKLYWDEENNQYIIEKKIKKIIYPNYQNTWINFSINDNEVCIASNGGTFTNAIGEPCHFGKYLFSCKTSRSVLDAHIYFYFSKELLAQQGYPFSYEGARKYLIDNNATLYLQVQKSKTIETTISEQKTLNCYNYITYVKLTNTNLSPIIKVKAPVNVNTSKQIFLSRENNFDSIFNVVLEPNKTANITFFEGGLDLKLTSGIEILNTGEVKVSNKDECYASKDFIDLASYTSSTFTIDTMDILFEVNSNKFTIYYYDKDKTFIDKKLIAFGNKSYVSNIQYPNNTQYCKIAFINKPDITSDYYKIRILRDKTKENGFKMIKKVFKNTDGWIQSFSEYVSIKDNIERLLFFTDNYDSINEFSIINNLDNNKKKYSYKIPKKIEPGETLSYSRSRNKQFVYKSSSIPYNNITSVSYDNPKNLANGVRFVLNKDIDSSTGVFGNGNNYCTTEQYINIVNYQEKTITLSVAANMTQSFIYFYGKDKKYISRKQSAKNFVTAIVPNNAHYIRCGCYLSTLASQSDETKELIRKHVMVTATNYRCDWAPNSILVVPEEINKNQYRLNLNNDNKYLFVKPYKFNYTLKDLNTFDKNTFIDDNNWKLDVFDKSDMTGNYATLNDINGKTPLKSSIVNTPSKVSTSNTIFKYSKFILASSAFTLRFTISVYSYGSIYFNNEHIGNYFNQTPTLDLNVKQGINKLDILGTVNAGSVNIIINQLNEITSSLENIEKVGSSCELLTIDTQSDNKFNVSNIFFHDIINGQLLIPKEETLELRLDSNTDDKFIFTKDFAHNSDQVIKGYVNTNVIQKDANSRTYVNRVVGGETNFTLLTAGGNICEIYFLNDNEVNDNSSYTLYAKYDSGHQKVKIDKIPDNAKHIAIVTDKQNEETKCSNIFLFPGEIEKKIDVTYEDFQMFDDFNQEIATLPYSSEIIISKNKMPDLSKLILDSSKYSYDEGNNRFIFPIKIKKESDIYYLQYWTQAPNQSLNIFIDSAEDMTDSRQYLCQHTTETVNNKYIQIHNDILASLNDDTLYLSVSLNDSNKSDILKFLVGGTYKFQLEKDAITQEYEPYEETTEHHPMYLTANGLTIESTSSYYGVRKLIAPQNVTSISNNGLTKITWDEVIGASHYILYLEGEAYQTVYTNSFETIAEIKGLMTVKAKNSITESEFSKAAFVHSVPTNPFIIRIENKYEDEKYKFYVYFKDNSSIEESFNLRYSIDGRQEQVINLPAVENIGETVEAYFAVTNIQENIAVRVTAINASGENEIPASHCILKRMPDFVWTYNEDNNKIVMAWDNKYPECSDYVVRYKKKDDEVAKTFKITNNYRENERVTYSIDLEPEDEMEVSISALKDKIYYIFTQPKKVSKDLDVTKTPPSNFTSRKPQNNTIEFSWFDNSTVETGWELVYSINNGSPQTITISTESKTTDYQLYKHLYKFEKHGYMTAKLRTIWELGASNFTESITNYYYPVGNEPPQGLKKRYASRTSILVTWEPPSYFESYEIVITKGDVSETIKTKDNRYIINLNDQVIEEYKVKVRTNFLGNQQSEFTDELIFTPTFSDNKILTTINTKCREEYVDIRKKTNEVSDEFYVVTKSTSKVSWSFPLATATLSRFQTYEGLLSMETWNTGQKTEYVDAMIIKTARVNMYEAILNTISYQETQYEGSFEGFIYTPSSISGKIVMEINKTRIVCIGDSITAGHPGFWAESMTGEITHQYPYWLDRRLRFQYEVINKGYGSDRTFNVLNRFQKDVLDLSPQYCLMQIGTNDIYWGGASADGSIEAFESSTLADMKKNVMTMVELCFQNNIVPIIGMLIPRTQVVTDPVVKHGLYKFNEWIIEYANSTEGLNYVDFFNAGKDKIPATPLEDPKSPGAMNPIYDGDNVYDEMGNLVKYGAGIHLNAAGYKIMAEAIPLNLFTTIQSGVKMYMDEKCTIEAEYNTEDKQNPFYEIEIEGMKLTRTKKIVRYIKNIGNTQVLFSIYPNDLHNLDYNFKFKDTDEGTKTISGILTPGNSKAIKMELTPLTEDSKSSIELSLVSREFSIETK